VSKLLNELAIGDLVNLGGADSRGLGIFIPEIVGVESCAIVVLGQDRPDVLGRKSVFVAEIGGDDSRNDDDRVWEPAYSSGT
jgi:hypothetical protein